MYPWCDISAAFGVRSDDIIVNCATKSLHLFVSLFQTETALVYDAVQLFAKALKAIPHLTDVRMTSLSCNQDRAWKHGARIVNFIKTVNLQYIS